MKKHELYCIVAWQKDGCGLLFWGAASGWGPSADAVYFARKVDAKRELVQAAPVGEGFLKANVMDVVAFNRKFDRSIGREKRVIVVPKYIVDERTGILRKG